MLFPLVDEPFFGPGAPNGTWTLEMEATVASHARYIEGLDEEARMALYRYTSSTEQIYVEGAEELRRLILGTVLDRPAPRHQLTLYSFTNNYRGNLSDLRVGSSWRTDRFTSSTYDREFSGEAFNTDLQRGGESVACCLLVITTDEGLCVESISAYPQQKEFLLPPGTFTVTDVSEKDVSFYTKTLSYAWKPITVGGRMRYDTGIIPRSVLSDPERAQLAYAGESLREGMPVMRDLTQIANPPRYVRRMRVVNVSFVYP